MFVNRVSLPESRSLTARFVIEVAFEIPIFPSFVQVKMEFLPIAISEIGKGSPCGLPSGDILTSQMLSSPLRPDRKASHLPSKDQAGQLSKAGGSGTRIGSPAATR